MHFTSRSMEIAVLQKSFGASTAGSFTRNYFTICSWLESVANRSQSGCSGLLIACRCTNRSTVACRELRVRLARHRCGGRRCETREATGGGRCRRAPRGCEKPDEQQRQLVSVGRWIYALGAMERRAILTQHPGQRRPAQPQPMLAREHRLQRQLPITEVQADLRGRRGSRNEASRDAVFASRTALTMRLQRIGASVFSSASPSR